MHELRAYHGEVGQGERVPSTWNLEYADFRATQTKGGGGAKIIGGRRIRGLKNGKTEIVVAA